MSSIINWSSSITRLSEAFPPFLTSIMYFKTVTLDCNNYMTIMFPLMISFVYSQVNVNSHGPPRTTQRILTWSIWPTHGESDSLILTHSGDIWQKQITQRILTWSIWPTGEYDSLILTHSGDIWQKQITQGNSDPNLKELLHIFSPFHLLAVNPYPLT